VKKISGYRYLQDVEQFKKLFGLVEQFTYSGDDDAHVSRYWAEQFVELYNSGRLLLSRSPRAKFIHSLASKDEELALYVLNHFLGHRVAIDSPKAVEAAVIAALYTRGIRKNVDSERAALQQLRNDWDDTLEEVKVDHQRLARHYELEHQQAITRVATVEEHASEFVARLKEELALQEELRSMQGQQFDKECELYREQGAESVEAIMAEVAAAKEELQRLTAAYNEHMALKAPVAYWQENGDMHKASARAYLKILALVAPASILSLSVLGWFLLGDEAKPPLGHMILFFMFSGMIVWLLRVLSRLYLSHKHLEVDARERIVAAKTYLALVGDGVEARDAERTIIMGTLFRPAAIGIIQDDAMPASSIELVGRLMKGDK
jgi:hypothetical protein